MSIQTLVVYRYKLSDDIMKEITNFAMIHQYDDRHSYKEAWAVWREENKDYLNREVQRLTEIGYDGSVEDKMYKAGRYYFRKKGLLSAGNTDANVNKDTKQRREYISIDRQVISLMDEHLKNTMKNSNTLSPAEMYNDFCKIHTNMPVFCEEIKRICANNRIKASDVSAKIKKTYKNRYYILSRA